MDLTYNILWFEDDRNFRKNLSKRIKRYLYQNYQLDVNFVEISSETEYKKKKINYQDFDLILLDFHLNNGETTEEIFDKIKDLDYYCEILFYSDKSDFESHIKENLLKFDGVFYKKARAQIFDKIAKIIDLTIKKLIDLNSLRGLVISETSDLDRKKVEIISKLYNKKKLGEDFILSYIFNKASEKQIDKLKEAFKYSNKQIKKDSIKSTTFDYPNYDLNHFLKNNILCDSDRKKDIIGELIKIFKIHSDYDLEEYKNKIQNRRNALAHEPKKIEGETIYYGKYKFSLTEYKLLRKDIRKYKDILEDLDKKVSEIIK